MFTVFRIFVYAVRTYPEVRALVLVIGSCLLVCCLISWYRMVVPLR
jgi:hypothetical protein